MPETHKFESRYTQTADRAVARGEGALPRPLADQLRRPDLVPRPHPPGRRRPGRAAGPGRADRRRALGARTSRTPTCCSRARTTASAARRTSSAAFEAELSFYGQVFGFDAGRRDRAGGGRVPRRAPGRRRREAWRPGDAAAPRHQRRGGRHRRRVRRPDARRSRSSCSCSLAATALAIVARRIGIPYPILLVLGGLALGFVPGPAADRARARDRLPAVPAADPLRGGLLHLDPRLQAQPPADHAAGGRARRCSRPSPSPSRRARWCRAWRWAAAFALGAIVVPARRGGRDGGLPAARRARRIVTILEGESLVNDATALVAYRFAIIAASDRRVLDRGRRLDVRRRRRQAGSRSGC